MRHYLSTVLIIFGLCVSSFGDKEISLSASEVLTKYDEMVSRLSCISMLLTSRASYIPVDPKYAVHENHLQVSRNGQDLDCFGTESIFDVNGICVFEEVICDMFIKDKYYVVNKWPVGGKPMYAQIGYNDAEELKGMHQGFLDAPEYGGGLWSRLDGCEGRNIPELLDMAEDLRIFGEMAELNGVNCHVLTGSTKYGVVTAWISPERSYNAVKYSVKRTASDMYDDYRLGDKIPGYGESVVTLEVSRFSKVEDVFVPSGGLYTKIIKNKDSCQEQNIEWKAGEIELNPDFTALNAFKFKIPDKTPLIVMYEPGIHYMWKDGDKVPLDDLTFDEIDKTVDEVKKKKQTGN